MSDEYNIDGAEEIKREDEVAPAEEEKETPADETLEPVQEDAPVEDAIEKPEENAEEGVAESDVEVIEPAAGDDAALDAPTVEMINTKRKIKSNKSMSKKKKGIIAVAIALVIVIVTLSIVLPVVFYQKPRIFVKTESGFVAGKKVGATSDYFYVLKKDLACESVEIKDSDVYSIDFAKHSLSVSGDFVINSDREGALYLGTREGKTEYSSKKASLSATNISITAPNMDVVLMADVSCENLNIDAKSVQLGNFGNSLSKADIKLQAEKVRLSGNIVGSTTGKIEISCSSVSVDSGVTVESELNLVQSVMTVEQNATLDTIILDSESKATIAGNITHAVIGGAQVNMEEGHSCRTYQDINTLVISRDTQKSHVIKNCKNVIYVEKLAQPVEINIEEHNNRIYCNVARVKYASGYRIMLNGEVIGELPAEFKAPGLDITDYVKEIGTYRVSVIPLGDFTSDADLTNQGHKTMYRDGAETSVQYNCVMTLQSPQNLRVDGDFILEFDSVLHADYYIVSVDGIMVVNNDITSTTADLSKHLSPMGNHSVRVQAYSLNDNIKNSAVSMVSYSTTEKLTTVDREQMRANFNADFTAIDVSWHGVPNGYDYVVYLEINGDRASRIELGRSSDVGETGAIMFKIKLDELPKDSQIVYDPDADTYYDIIVVAAEHDYYTRSDETVCHVTVSDTTAAGK